MNKTRVLSINAQEGLLIGENNDTIFAFFSHHNTILVCHSPWSEDDFEIPENLTSYEVSVNWAAHISITGWAKDGERDSHWFKEQNRAITAEAVKKIKAKK
jgi:hypothetical protein